MKKEAKDKGAISYSIENGSELGLSIDSKSGVISIADYSKVMEAIEAGNGILNVTIKADKAEYSKRGWWSKANYPADSTSYTLKISMSDAPTSAYKIYAADDLETELIKPNGENDWYNTTLIVKPADGYSIIRADELTKDKPSFKDSVKFGETEAKDQGASLSHYIYLEETATGNITKKVEISNLKLDTIAPYNLNIDFPDVEEKDSVKYYGDYITLINVIINLFASVIEVRNNGFLACQCIDLSWDKIFVEQNTLKVKLVYLPLSVRAFDSYAEFESELRSSIVKLADKVITSSNARLDQFVQDLCNGSMSLEDVYNKSRGVGTAPIVRSEARSQMMPGTSANGSIKLVAMNAPSHFELVIDRDDAVIGKKQELVDMVIPFNRMISRKHCRITNRTGIYYINDEGSANGTFVNGVRLNPGQKAQINRGDIIRMADSDFQIV